MNEIIEILEKISLLEASELVKLIEDTFDVDASAAASGGNIVAGPTSAVEEVKKKQNLTLCWKTFLLIRKLLF